MLDCPDRRHRAARGPRLRRTDRLLQDAAVVRITQRVMGLRRVLGGHRRFDAGPARDDVAHVQSVAVARSHRALARAVVIHGHLAVDDLLLGVGVDVGNAEAVRALTGEGLTAAILVAVSTPLGLAVATRRRRASHEPAGTFP